MNELRQIVRVARQQMAAGKPCVLATVVSRQGSTYRRPGARALIDRQGQITGLIGGGCLEDELVEQAMDLFEQDGPRLLEFDNRGEADRLWGHGLGCAGKIGILLERLDRQPALLALLTDCVENRRSQVLATRLPHRAAAVPESALHWRREDQDRFVPLSGEAPPRILSVTPDHPCCLHEQDGHRWLIETLQAPIRLLVFGGGYDVQPVVQLATTLGWECLVHTGRGDLPDQLPEARYLSEPASADFNTRHIDSRTAILLMTHHFDTDKHWLTQVLDSGAAYIGALGPARRLADMLAEIKPATPPPDRLHGPVGLELGGDSPQDIALSLIAEIQAVIHRKDARPLRDKAGPIHDAP